MSIQALYVDTSKHGIYPHLLGVENCWGQDRDARNYAGSETVPTHGRSGWEKVAQRFVNLLARRAGLG